MLMPKRVKYRKQQRGRRAGHAKGGFNIDFGDFAMQAVTPGWITSRQIESARVAIQRSLHGDGKLWIRIFSDKPVSKTPAQKSMGKGKGGPEFWVSVVKPGRVMFEIAGVSPDVAQRAIELAAYKLPIRVRFIKREGV